MAVSDCISDSCLWFGHTGYTGLFSWEEFFQSFYCKPRFELYKFKVIDGDFVIFVEGIYKLSILFACKFVQKCIVQ